MLGESRMLLVVYLSISVIVRVTILVTFAWSTFTITKALPVVSFSNMSSALEALVTTLPFASIIVETMGLGAVML